MFGWLFPRPPLRLLDKAWTEYRFGWLVEKFGADRLLNAPVVLPNDEFFPDAYDNRPEDAEAILWRLCRFMGVPPGRVGFEVLPDDDMPSAAGHYDPTDPERPVIRLAESQLADPQAVVATLVHELAHDLLLGEGLLTGEEDDHEWVTDLLPAFLGLGIFSANSTIREGYFHAGAVSWWTMNRTGCLPSHVLGYAMAISCYLRGEHRPAWAHHLRLDARAALVGGLRYLRRTGDCCLHPGVQGLRVKHSPTELAQLLSRGSPSARIVAMWDARDQGNTSFGSHVQRLLRHRASDVRCTAVRILPTMEMEDPSCVDEVTHMLRDHDEGVRAAAAAALEVLQPDCETAIFELGRLLGDGTSEVVYAAAAALRAYGARAQRVEKDVLRALHQALIACSYSLIELLIDALRHIADDPGQSINNYFVERDPEFRQMAIDALYSGDASGIIYSDES